MRAAIVLLALASSARAQTAELSLERWDARDRVARPYRYVVEVRGRAPLELVTDRRLLSFEVHAGGRRHRCAHPHAPRSVAAGRVHRWDRDGTWREWIDLRMYCTGRALAALDGGAEVRARYGWPRATRTRWVAREPGAEPRAAVASLEAPPFSFEARPPPREPPGPITLELAPRSARLGRGLVFRVVVRSREGPLRAYVRPDAFGFVVHGPLGRTVCRTEMGGGAPPAELYRRITPRRAARESLDVDFFCPEGTFELAGVYQVIPKLRLAHDGEEWGLRALTGRFAGVPAIVRITLGERGYVEQVVSSPQEPGDE